MRRANGFGIRGSRRVSPTCVGGLPSPRERRRVALAPPVPTPRRLAAVGSGHGGAEVPGVRLFESIRHSSYPEPVKTLPPTLSPDGLRTALRAFCERHPIRRLDVFGSAARGQASPRSDVDLLVTLDDSVPVSTREILEMAGEAEEIVGVPVDFVLRQALDQSPNGFAREHILATAVQLYGR
jgi:predicted nucleotidyltransferase